MNTIVNRSATLDSLTHLNEKIRSLCGDVFPEGGLQGPIKELAVKAELGNPWFTERSVHMSLGGIATLLEKTQLQNWASQYPEISEPKKIGVVMAGNIPMAGFHDLLCILMSGHDAVIKLSRDDSVLIPYLMNELASVNKEIAQKVTFTDKLNGVDAVIATGSNNTFRYFEHYFAHLPHIFRKNRNSVAVITGTENEYDHLLLGRDIFTYFGLGCRNISKLYVPAGYSFDEFFRNLTPYAYVMEHNKYMNNHDYQSALLLMNNTPFLTNNFLIVKEDSSLASPVAVLHYELYNNAAHLETLLDAEAQNLQCIVSKTETEGWVMPGHAQLPVISDYADNVDTMKFLTEL